MVLKKKSNVLRNVLVGAGVFLLLAFIVFSVMQSSYTYSFYGGDINATWESTGDRYFQDFEDGADYLTVAGQTKAPTGWTLVGGANQYTYIGASIEPWKNTFNDVSGSYMYNIRQYSGSGSTAYITRDFNEDLGGRSIDFYYATQEDSSITTTAKLQFLDGVGSLVSEEILSESNLIWVNKNFEIPTGTEQIRFWWNNPSSGWGASLLLDDILVGNPSYQLTISDNFTTEINEFIEGDVVTLSALPKEDFVFAGWSGDYESEEQNITITINSDMSLIANFEVGETIVYVSSGQRRATEYHDFYEETVDEYYEEEVIEPEISTISKMSTSVKGFFTTIWDKILGVFKW